MLVHLDTDIGGDTDDVFALAMLLRSGGVEIAGISTSTEIGGKRAAMARYVVRLAGNNSTPVAAGAEGKLGPSSWPILPQIPAESLFWPDGLDPVHSSPGEVIDLLDASITRGATVIAIGPLTNLAAYEAIRPGRLATVPVFICGGWINFARDGFPQWSSEVDYNIQQDQEASRLVISRCAPTLIPISITAEVFLREADLPRLEAEGPLGRLVAHQAKLQAAYEKKQEYGRQFSLLPDDLLNFHYDPLTCAAAIGWNGIEISDLSIALNNCDGFILMRPDPNGVPVRFATAVDGPRFNRDWLDVVTSRK
jgi:inosine-uridine nucleoside N-ribohydrolase